MAANHENEATKYFQVQLRIRKLEFFGVDLTPVIRVGWLDGDFSVFSHWKRMKEDASDDGVKCVSIGWKTSLINTISDSGGDPEVNLVFFQKPGGRSDWGSPIALRKIPIRFLGDSTNHLKHIFRLPLQEMCGGAGVAGRIDGYVRAVPVEPSFNLLDSQTDFYMFPDEFTDLDPELPILPSYYCPLVSDKVIYKNLLENLKSWKSTPRIKHVLLHGKREKLDLPANICHGANHFLMNLGIMADGMGWFCNQFCDFESIQEVAREIWSTG